MTGYNPEWRKEDEQRVKELDLWYKLDGRDKDHPNTLVGTAGYKKYAQKMARGSEWGKQFINKYKKKA